MHGRGLIHKKAEACEPKGALLLALKNIQVVPTTARNVPQTATLKLRKHGKNLGPMESAAADRCRLGANA